MRRLTFESLSKVKLVKATTLTFYNSCYHTNHLTNLFLVSPSVR
ncbi:MAG: hypothetical protein ACTS47_00850 [Candidatus Hodgkinia cicadicola]